MSARDGVILRGEDATLAFGARLARGVHGGGLVFLSGDLGTGKTTLVRGLLRGLGHAGAVRSPTFTLVEPYPELDPPVYHLDLYRLGSAEELELIGVRDYLVPGTLCLVEWPERGAGVVDRPDLGIALAHAGAARRLAVTAATPRGEKMASAALGGS